MDARALHQHANAALMHPGASAEPNSLLSKTPRGGLPLYQHWSQQACPPHVTSCNAAAHHGGRPTIQRTAPTVAPPTEDLAIPLVCRQPSSISIRCTVRLAATTGSLHVRMFGVVWERGMVVLALVPCHGVVFPTRLGAPPALKEPSQHLTHTHACETTAAVTSPPGRPCVLMLLSLIVAAV